MKRLRPGYLSTAAAILALLVLGSRITRTVETAPPGFESTVQAAFAEQRSGVWVEGHGTLVRHLSDDRAGSNHQRFVVQLGSGQTLLVSHNIDIAQRVSGTEVGDRISFRGRYEWNEQGGVVHWTHRDPDGRLEGGWIEAEGHRVR